jgi:MSHA pilin protein MshA
MGMIQMSSRARGFTMIELIAVIVILGVLSASALPRVVNLGREARIAALQGFALAARSAANMGRSACALQPLNCQLDADGWAGKYVLFQGKQIWVHQGWPTGWGRFGVDNGQGALGDLMNASADFAYQAHLGGSYQTVYRLTKAPDPTNCSVTYQLAATDASMSTSIQSSGC